MLQNKRVSIGRLGTAVCYNEIMRRERQTRSIWFLRIDKPTQNRDRPQAVAVFKRPFADRGGFSYRDGVTGKEELGLIRNEEPSPDTIRFRRWHYSKCSVGGCRRVLLKNARAVVHIMGIYNKRVWVFVRAGADERRSRKGIVLIKIAMKIIFRILYMRIGWRKRHGHSQTGYPVFS